MGTKDPVSVRPRVRTNVAEEWFGQEVFIYDPGNGDEVHRLNSGAALIWLLCDGSRDLPSIAQELAKAFELPKKEILADVRETVGQFESLNLIEA
jgi:hypothetical protein